MSVRLVPVGAGAGEDDGSALDVSDHETTEASDLVTG